MNEYISTFSIESVENHRGFVNRQIIESWAGPYVAAKGVLHDTRTHPGFAAVGNGEVAGFILYNIVENECEITVLESLCEGQGIGSALTNAVIQAAKDAGCDIDYNRESHA